jgi:hypothetical protein
MHPGDVPQDEPDEHLRYWAYLSEFAQVAEADELAMVTRVLSDPDLVMAQSAILEHLERRGCDLYLGFAFEPWAEAMARATAGHPLLTRRLQEWSPFRAIMLGQPWDPAALLESSGWLQRKVAATPGHEALQLLADSGPSKRIRNTARASLKQQGSS